MLGYEPKSYDVGQDFVLWDRVITQDIQFGQLIIVTLNIGTELDFKSRTFIVNMAKGMFHMHMMLSNLRLIGVIGGL